MPMERYDVVVIGGGPAGLAAAIEAEKEGARVLLVERENRLGGILKQCIHDGFGLLRFGEMLSGPEYAARFIDELGERVSISTLTTVVRAQRTDEGFLLTLVSRAGLRCIQTNALVLATGCRERTSRQIGVHGRHCAGVFTAGSAQYDVNILGKMPTRRCVILGSGDIGLIMARRLTLEGAKVVAVYEAKPTPSGLSRNISQCLDDFGIPLYTSKTVTRLIGEQRLTAVVCSDVDERMCPIEGTESVVPCDALILSVGLIPENELAESLDVPLDAKTKGPIVDESNQTLFQGVFSCGNALFVNDLADYVSESGERAGKAAAHYTACQRDLIPVYSDTQILSLSPQRLDRAYAEDTRVFFLRAAKEMANAVLTVSIDEHILFEKRFSHLRPPEMERISLNIPQDALKGAKQVRFALKETSV